MSNKKKEPSGCGCANIPISVILLILGGGYWWFTNQGHLYISKLLPDNLPIAIPGLNSTPTEPPITPTPTLPSSPIVEPNNQPTSQRAQNPPSKGKDDSLPKTITPQTPQATSYTPTPWEKKLIRGIYLSRYQVTNNASEQKIRQRVRYYHSQGINTIIHGVWGNACTMYNSQVMQQTFGYKSCPNLFRDRWLDWLIDEAHKNGMEVHAYFEKGNNLVMMKT
ncbi:MAG: family 10 glycosylhydrolase [Xenococcaceae cyanobacterium MO_234.B1]|nr:family 10 glycosylhydrolase [Xenococcaceae cyanobacterium MO_234.B1]